MRSTTKFKKIEMTKDGQGMTFAFAQSAATKSGDVIDTDAKGFTVHKAPHEDFCNAFHSFIPHLLYSMGLQPVRETETGWYESLAFTDDERFDNITVTGVVLVGKEENKIKIVGRVTNDNGDVSSLVSPIIDLEHNGSGGYVLQTILADAFKAFLHEADEYWSKQKYAPNPQQELELK